jgi:hypothetical protein
MEKYYMHKLHKIHIKRNGIILKYQIVVALTKGRTIPSKKNNLNNNKKDEKLVKI